MSSPSKIQSARANGALSHGPVTSEGKQASSRNSTRHGLLSQTVVLEGESKERFEELLLALTAELKPRTTIEASLVETMAVARWRHLRVLGIQKAEFDLEMARQAVPESKPVRAAIVFRNLADNSRVLDVLLRYEVAYDRQFSRALNMLLKLRATGNQESDALPKPAAENRDLSPSDETSPKEVKIMKFPNEPNSQPAPAPTNGAAAPETHVLGETSHDSSLVCCCSPSGVPIDTRRPDVVSSPSHKTIPGSSGAARGAAAAA
jgi:hypothetical protein